MKKKRKEKWTKNVVTIQFRFFAIYSYCSVIDLAIKYTVSINWLGHSNMFSTSCDRLGTAGVVGFFFGVWLCMSMQRYT